MAKDKPESNPLLGARVTPDVRDRIDALAAAITASAAPGTRPYGRGDVIRLLILRALPDVEREHGIGRAPAKVQKGGKAPRKA